MWHRGECAAANRLRGQPRAAARPATPRRGQWRTGAFPLRGQVARRALGQRRFSGQSWHPLPKIPKSKHRPFRPQPAGCGPSKPAPAGAPRRQPKPQHQLGPPPGQPRAAFRRVATAITGTQAPFRAVPEWPAESRWPARAPGRPRRRAKNPQKPTKTGRRHRRAGAPCNALLPIIHPVFSRDTEGH